MQDSVGIDMKQVIAFLITLFIINNDVAFAQSPKTFWPSLVGTWSSRGREIVIDEQGRVWSYNGGLQGRVANTSAGGGNFAFEGEYSGGLYRCVYDITFLRDPNRSQWRVIYPLTRPVGVPCPDGEFDRAR
jgi:hypothetical protein